MAAPRKPDRELLAAMEEARKRREEAQATFDRKVKRAHEDGSTPVEIGREIGSTRDRVLTSLKRQGLTPNAPVMLTTKQSLLQKAAHRRKHG